MGQINCQCQEVMLEHEVVSCSGGKNKRNQYTITFSPQHAEDIRHTCTILTLKNSISRYNIKINEG